MAEPAAASVTDWPAEVARLHKIIRALMDRAERSTAVQESDFSLFQATIMLEEQVRLHTAELEAALRKNEKINRALRESEAKFRALAKQSLVGIAMIEHGRFIYTNDKLQEIFGYSSDELCQMSPLDVTFASDRPRVAEELRKRLRGEVDQVAYVFRGLRKDGGVLEIEIHGRVINVGGKLLLISVLMDITERARTERALQKIQDELREQSTHDALTGLYNRHYLDDTLGRELLLAERDGHPVAVIMADLDHFKSVNDRHGHPAGDEVLRVFGALMKRYARGSDIYCRYGGEEFLLVLPRMNEESAVARAEQLRAAMAGERVEYGGAVISVTTSFGIATYPRHGRDAAELVAAADRALYAAKAAGRDQVNVALPGSGQHRS